MLSFHPAVCVCVMVVKRIYNLNPRWGMDFMCVISDRIDIFKAYSRYKALCDMFTISKGGRHRAELATWRVYPTVE